jgi:ethanolamine utilization protein EutQ (cupin superfamily)
MTEIRTIRKYTADNATDWMEWSGIALADVVNEDEMPFAKLGGVGFTRAPKGSSSDFEFAYDEVLVVTKGRCSVRSGEMTTTVHPGEVVYLPAGVAGTFVADDDVELVYVASSPYGEVNREIKAQLLARSGA